MTLFSPAQQRTLDAVCQTLVPRLAQPASPLYQTGAADIGLAVQLETALERVAEPADRLALRGFLSLIERPAFNRALCGVGLAFSAMSESQREHLLRSCAHSRLPQARQLFQSLKRLGLFIFYSAADASGHHAAWDELNYRIPDFQVPQRPTPIRPLDVTHNTRLTCDALVIGSGAGGGVAAAELAAAGLDVLVVEKGEQRADHEFDGRELDATEKLYEKHGALTTLDKGMVVLAGSTFGGGTTINWTGSLRTPEYVLEEWARHGLTGATTPAYQASLDAVSARMNLDMTPAATPQNQVLERGCAALGYDCRPIPRNASGCEDCGFCNFGCAFGQKQGTAKTFLADAAAHGARFLVRAQARRVLIEHGKAVGALVQARGPDGQPYAVEIRARMVVLAGGALNTPALLLRSGVAHEQVGANLRLHPTTVVFGVFGELVRGWQGAPMTRVCAEFANLDGAGYGVRLECAPVHPGIAALSVPWESGRQHKDVMAQLEHLSNIIILARDRYGGRVRVNRRGALLIDYRLHEHDAGHLRRGIREALRVLDAAGAHSLSLPHIASPMYVRGQAGGLAAFLAQADRAPMGSNQFGLFSAHQMGSCRIGTSRRTGALTPEGELYDVKNCFVLDASAMPTCSGVNPMLSIMGLAHYLAQGIRARV
jgi:choline dehydrogenase-like flavoprotein